MFTDKTNLLMVAQNLLIKPRPFSKFLAYDFFQGNFNFKGFGLKYYRLVRLSFKCININNLHKI